MYRRTNGRTDGQTVIFDDMCVHYVLLWVFIWMWQIKVFVNLCKPILLYMMWYHSLTLLISVVVCHRVVTLLLLFYNESSTRWLSPCIHTLRHKTFESHPFSLVRFSFFFSSIYQFIQFVFWVKMIKSISFRNN